MDRRRFIAASAATACPGAIAFAGCVGGENETGDRGDDQPKATEEPDATTDDTDDAHDDSDDDTDDTDEPEDAFKSIEHDGRPITGYEFDVRDEREGGFPFWIDDDETVWGRSGPRLLRSDDWWETTEQVYSFANEVKGYNANIIQSVVVPENGRVICGVGGRGDKHKETGRLCRMNESLDDHEVVYEFEYGRPVGTFGHSTWEDIVIWGSYGRSDFEGERHPDEVALSTDGGATFEHVLTAEFQSADAANHHIHDVEWDPYADRIWVTVGDGPNAQIYWSDDLGDSWDHLEEYGIHEMPTQVAAFRDNVVFGTDGNPDGILRWARDDPNDAPESVDDLERPQIQLHDDEHAGEMRTYARGRWHIREDLDTGRELCIMPFGYSPMHPDARESIVIASVDGDAWYEILRTEDERTLTTNVLGPLSMDGDRRALISNSALYDGYQFDGIVPEFWVEQLPDRDDEDETDDG
jgi:hypothetical protein